MKRNIALNFIVSILFAGMAHGQGSVCPPGHEELCHHPSTSTGNPGGGRQPQQQEDSGPTRADLAQGSANSANDAMDRWHHTKSVADYNEAMEGFNRSLQFVPHFVPAMVGRLELLHQDGTDHRQAFEVAKQGYMDGFRYGGQTKAVHAWFALIMDFEYQEDEKERYSRQCGEVRTSASSSGVVNPAVDVMKELKKCQNWKAKLDKEQVKVNAKVEKYNTKYN
jgi:hypothetical protein